MTLSPEAIDAFKRVYASEFGEVLSNDDAEEMALRLLRVFDLLSRRLPDDETSATEDA